MKTRAYYIPDYNTRNPAEAHLGADADYIRQEIEVTTEHPLSSYGQPVILEEGKDAVPAQNFAPSIQLMFADATEEAKTLVAKANKLGGKDAKTPAEERDLFSGLFGAN